MPKAFRKEFRTEGCTAHIRKRKSGKTHWNYEVRYRRHGYNISASANNLEEAKMKFLVKLKEAEKTGRKAPEKKPTSKKLGEFADYIFETYYKRKVKATGIESATVLDGGFPPVLCRLPWQYVTVFPAVVSLPKQKSARPKLLRTPRDAIFEGFVPRRRKVYRT